MLQKKIMKARKQGPMSREFLYTEAAKHAPRAIEVLVEIMNRQNGQDTNRMGAARTILAKVVPDMKAMELTGPEGGPLQLKYVIDLAGGYIPPLGAFNAPPSGSDERPAQIQSAGVAQESQEDNDSTNRTSEAGTV